MVFCMRGDPLPEKHLHEHNSLVLGGYFGLLNSLCAPFCNDPLPILFSLQVKVVLS